MSRLTVHLYGSIAQQSGVNASSCEVDVPGRATLRSVFKLIADRYGQQFLDAVVDPITGELQPFLHVIVNNQSVRTLKGLDTEVDFRDHILVHVLAGIGGG